MLYGVIRGTTKLRDAAVHIKDTAVTAFAGAIEQERSGELGQRMASAVGRSVGKAVGLVFGPVGAKVGAAVGSFLAQEVSGETVVKAAKAVAGAAKSIISTGAEIIKVVGATIKNGIKNVKARLFG